MVKHIIYSKPYNIKQNQKRQACARTGLWALIKRDQNILYHNTVCVFSLKSHKTKQKGRREKRSRPKQDLMRALAQKKFLIMLSN